MLDQRVSGVWVGRRWDISWRSLEGFTLPQGLHVAANWLSRPGLPGRLADAKRVADLVAPELDPIPGAVSSTSPS